MPSLKVVEPLKPPAGPSRGGARDATKYIHFFSPESIGTSPDEKDGVGMCISTSSIDGCP